MLTIVKDFDEDETYTIGNRVMTILISDAMPTDLIGTQDDNFYTHYSVIATMEANWGLHHLGRWDTWANVFSWVAKLTGDVVREPDVPLTNVFMNQSYPGAFAVSNWGPMPAPNVSGIVNGRTIFPEVLEQWGDVSHLKSLLGWC
jgi:acid phosphatase